MASIGLQDIGLLPAQLRAVQRRAKRLGQTTPEYVRSLIERDLIAIQSFDAILRPVRRDFRARGITPRQLDAIIDRARAHTRDKRRKSR